METVRGYVDGWYDEVLTDRIPIAEGHLSLPDRPGLGTRMREDLLSRPNVRVETTTLEDLGALVDSQPRTFSCSAHACRAVRRLDQARQPARESGEQDQQHDHGHLGGDERYPRP